MELTPMRAAIAVILAFSFALPLAGASAQQLQQSVKYTLMIIAAGVNDGAKRDGVAMGGSGIYPGRQECEAAGAGIKYGVVNPVEGQSPPVITWVCIPLGKP